MSWKFFDTLGKIKSVRTDRTSRNRRMLTPPVGTYYITEADEIVPIDTTVFPHTTVYLPGNHSAGQEYTIVDVGGNASAWNIGLNTEDGDDISGSGSTKLIDTDYGSVTVISDGGDWFIVRET